MKNRTWGSAEVNGVPCPILHVHVFEDVAYLLVHERVQGDLFRLTTAYNGGPGNLGKWERAIQADGDPLLFIEALPSKETRLFIERVLTNLWIYRHRLGPPERKSVV